MMGGQQGGPGMMGGQQGGQGMQRPPMIGNHLVCVATCGEKEVIVPAGIADDCSDLNGVSCGDDEEVSAATKVLK
jgi:hypothetical protein